MEGVERPCCVSGIKRVCVQPASTPPVITQYGDEMNCLFKREFNARARGPLPRRHTTSDEHCSKL